MGLPAAKKTTTQTSLQTILEQNSNLWRERLPAFLAQHFTLQECTQILKRHIVLDLVRNPINALWAIPSLSVRKSLEAADKLGWDRAKPIGAKVPTALKTGYQKEIERLILNELFGSTGKGSLFAQRLANDPQFASFLSSPKGAAILESIERDIRDEVSEYCEKQNAVTDLAASGVTLLLADAFFGDKSLDVFGIGKKIASLWAKNDAADSFFLGKSIGRAFYDIAPPEPSNTQVFFATLGAMLSLAIFSTAVGLLSYPLYNKLGIHTKQLKKRIDMIEDKLLLKLTKAMKN